MSDRSPIVSYTEYRKRAAQPALASPHGPADQRSARFACCTARFGRTRERYPMRLMPRRCWAASRPRAQTQIPAQKAGVLTYPSYSREFDLGYPRTLGGRSHSPRQLSPHSGSQSRRDRPFWLPALGLRCLVDTESGIILYCPKLRQPCGFPSDLNQYPLLMGRVGCSAIFISGEVNCTEAIGLFRLIPLLRRYMWPSVRCELATFCRSDIKSPHPRLKFPWLGTVRPHRLSDCNITSPQSLQGTPQ